MPKSLKKRRTYKRRKSAKGGCGCNLQRGGYSLKKLSLIKSLKSKSKKSRRRIIMKGGLGGGQTNTSLAFGTLGGAFTTANVLSGAPSSNGGDPVVVTFANNENSRPMV